MLAFIAALASSPVVTLPVIAALTLILVLTILYDNKRLRDMTAKAEAASVAALVIFHAPDGSPIALDPSNGQLIIRHAPPGYAGRTMIETGVGSVVVSESFCEVVHALKRALDEIAAGDGGTSFGGKQSPVPEDARKNAGDARKNAGSGIFVPSVPAIT